MELFKDTARISSGIELDGKQSVLIAGPCAIESLDICMEVGRKVKEISEGLGIPYVFKASFDKANRTSKSSYRGLGIAQGLEILAQVKDELDLPVLTDVHETNQVEKVAEVVDIIQIPAFLCRQTDLLEAVGNSGKSVNLKKGQFMAPGDMKFAVEKVKASGNHNIFLTERGSSFGYHNLVVDFRSIPIMRQFAPVIFDVTHSIQMPGGAGGSSSGQKEFAPYLARAANAVGVDGFFIETHPDPDKALSDGPNMVPLSELEPFLRNLFFNGNK